MMSKTTQYPHPDITENLFKLYLNSNMTQEKFGKIMKKKRKTTNHYLHGISQPTATDIKMLCEYFNISADTLLGIRSKDE